MAGPDKDEFYQLTWCRCKECYTMTTKADEICCVPVANQSMETQCIVNYVTFSNFVEDELATGKLDEWEAKEATWAYPYKPKENADYRRKAYEKLKSEFATKKIPVMYEQDWTSNLPSCVKWHIRKKFPEADGKYTGYFPPSDDLLKSTVDSYNAFKKHVRHITEVVNAVNINLKLPLPLIVPKLIRDELIRMGEISIMAAFEAFAYDSLRLSFDVGLSKMDVTEEDFCDWLEKKAPQVKDTNTDRREHIYGRIYGKCGITNPLSPETNPEWIKAAQSTIYKTLMQDPNSKLTMTFMQTVIKSSKKSKSHVQNPIASEFVKALKNAIVEPGEDPYFPKPNVESLMEYFAAAVTWSVVLPSGEEPSITIHSFKTLDALSKLFYGIRCVHVHGDAERTTIQKKGVLTKLVLDDTTLRFSSDSYSSRDEVEQFFKDTLADMKIQGKKVKHGFCIYQTMLNFYIFFAELLGKVCGCVVYYNMRQFNIKSNGTKGQAFNLTISELEDAIQNSASTSPNP